MIAATQDFLISNFDTAATLQEQQKCKKGITELAM